MKESSTRNQSNADISDSAGASTGWRSSYMLMRIPFSIYFMPVFWFALSNTEDFDGWTALALFIIIHILLYPSAIGYNYYFNPNNSDFPAHHRPTGFGSELFWLVMLFDTMAVLSAWFISPLLAMLTLIYALGSKTHGIAQPWLQRLPSLSTAIVSVFQGAFVYGMVLIGLEEEINETQLVYAGISSLFIAGIYPLTHISQTRQKQLHTPQKPGPIATFIYALLMFVLAYVALVLTYYAEARLGELIIFSTCAIAPLIYFLRWTRLVWQDPDHANNQNANNLQATASIAFTLAFIVMMF